MKYKKTLGDHIKDGTIKATFQTSLEWVWKASFNEALKTMTIKEAQEKAWDDVEIAVMEMLERRTK